MKKIIRLTERDLTHIVKRVIMEQQTIGLAGTKGGSVKDVVTSLNRGEINPKIGDMFKYKGEQGGHLRFKITSKEGEMFNGTVMGVFGKEFTEANPDYKPAKVGDPVKIKMDNFDEFEMYLPKSFGKSDIGSNIRDLVKLN